MCANPSLAEPRDRDGLTESVEFASPTCYASIPAAGCPVDNVLQLKLRKASRRRASGEREG
jgi:hypothetical protein